VAVAEERVATLRLDDQAYVSYSDTQNVKLPLGTFIRFRLGSASADGSIPITVTTYAYDGLDRLTSRSGRSRW